jgi:translation elongation factor EF-4
MDNTTPPVWRGVTSGARWRTFAIISHPDAGKTTLTKKLHALIPALGTSMKPLDSDLRRC